MSNRFYHLCTEIMNMCYLNLLWILFTCLGGGIFGLFPATAAVYAIYRQRLKTPGIFPYFNKFFYYYKKFFVQLNKCAFFFMVVVSFFLLNFN